MFNFVNILKWIMALLAIGTFYLFIRNIFSLFFSIDNNALHKKRLKQLQFNTKRTSSDAMSTKEFIDKFTNPVSKYVIPNFKELGDMTQLERDLEMSQWNKYYTPTTFVAMDITLKILGCFMFVIIAPHSWQFALVWFVLLFFLFKFLFKNSINERKFRLLSQFPEFIRITQGFLMSNMPLPQSIENALPYVGEEWRPLLQEFVINTEVYSQSECIDMLSNKVDIFEVRELWSLIKLNAEQGIDIKESFNNQAEKVRAMQLEVMMDKIGKRQTMAIIVQAPLLLTMIISFGLPTFASMTNLGF